ncbi:MAG TPA: isoleucine--tRNA ligase, partial [Rhizobiales bacterium]|nr:isoleucine--tRNA ligase [Hyphomicrobiales bacterium]
MSRQDDGKESGARDWRETLFLPKTDFPMKAGLPAREPEMLARWERLGLYERLREDAKGREKYILHDGPPYANGNIHIGTGLNKILKDVIVRSRQMMGKDANYVPGWDCHGLPIEWKIEEQYRSQGKDKDEVPINEFRAECREFADQWINVQREEFKRLGVTGDWDNPYTTMSFDAEATIANELMKFAMNGLLYRGSKPVMWSVVERTALAEAEVEYQEISSPTIWVKFPVKYGKGGSSPKWISREEPTSQPDMKYVFPGDFILIWTTTPWTIPGNRAISFSRSIEYGRYLVETAENDFGPRPGEHILVADKLADECAEKAKITLRRTDDVPSELISGIRCRHPLRDLGFDFDVPLLEGDHVTEETGTGFVHTAPGHGRDDFDIWTENRAWLEQRGIDPTIPYTVGPDGVFTADAPGFEGKVVINDKGKFGDANDAVIKALIEADALFSRGRLTHDYPHSWRSKKPVIFRNTPQWFIAMDKDIEGAGDTLRARALRAISETRWVPSTGQNRITGMINTKPDWVISRQRAWGVPITVFRNTESDEVIPRAGFGKSDELIARITDAFAKEGADAWFA